MPTRQQLESALVNADKAGDTQAAQQLANAIKGGQFEKETGFIDDVGTALSQRGEQFGKNIQPITDDLLSLNPLTSIPAFQKALTRTGGLLAGGAGDVIGAGVANIADTLIPESIQDKLKGFIGDIGSSQPVQQAIQFGSEFKQQNPDTAQTLADIANMAGIIPLGKAGQLASKTVSEAIPQSAAKQTIAKNIADETGDISTALFKLKPDGVKVTKDVLASKAVDQGFDESIIAAVKSSNPVDKTAMLKMVNIMEKGKKNARFSIENRPSDVVGDALVKRLDIVINKNKQSGKLLDRVANTLKGKLVNVEKPIDDFINNLSELGVTFSDNLKPIFKGSDIEGVTGAENIISKIISRMTNTKIPDAHDVHRLKRFIDEQVTFGKTAEGLSGKSVGVIKKLRANLDFELDSNFPRYNTVNTAYADTINAINDFQDVAGQKLNLTGKNTNKALGTLTRRIMSNQQSRVRLLDTMNDLEGTAKKYGGKFKDDIKNLALFSDELDKVFKPVARTSFQGQIAQSVDRAAASLTTSGQSTILNAAKNVANKLQGVNEENAFKSIKALLGGKK